MNTEVSVIGTTGSAFLPLGGSHNCIYGLQITPVYIAMNRHVVGDCGPKRGISAVDRGARVRSNPLRAAAIVKGRQRLAIVANQRNPGFRPLSTLRLAAGLSQAELADKMDMKQPNIARLEKRPGDPSLSTLQKLASVLGVDIREVIAAVEVTNRAEVDHA
ncbi:helix-turn-helix domain-containing protein [Denitromonas sp.]|uniref:helix-turn-helix domain-containing protein n=1 Tax=Denitromonas sp. TaxID=2734609 RepID=UPI003A8AC51A